MKKRILCIALILVMVLSFMPAAAAADPAETDYGRINDIAVLETDGYYVWMGGDSPIRWHIIGADSSNYLLISADVLDDTMNWTDAKDYGTESVLPGFSAVEKSAIPDTEKMEPDEYSYTAGSDADPILLGPSSVKSKLFLLSAEEAETYFTSDEDRKVESGSWWLRSPGKETDNRASVVSLDGKVQVVDTKDEDKTASSRPAFQLDRSAVLFESAAEGTKSSAVEGGGSFGSISGPSGTDHNEIKLTLIDSTRSGFSANVAGESSAAVTPGGSLTISYGGAKAGDNISALLCQGGSILYYATTEQTSDGSWTVTLPAGLSGSYILKIFSEEQNGDKMTDYASPAAEIALTAPTTYSVTVNNGTADKTNAAAGESVQITAGTAPEGQQFKAWTGVDGLTFAEGSSATTSPATFTMPSQAVSLTATYEDIPAPTYTVTVNNGTADKTSAAAGESVQITAGTAPEGQQFKEWTGVDGLIFAEGSSATTSPATFTMPAQAVSLTATYEDIPAPTYSVTVNNGTADKTSAAAGESVQITADTAPEGQQFKAWTGVDGLTFAEGSSATTSPATFTMPAQAVSLTATYEEIPAPTYSVTVNNGTADKTSAAAGESVQITAGTAPEGQQFKAWTGVDDLTFAEGSSATTSPATFTMPAKAVSLTATYEDIPASTYTVTVTNDGHGTGSASPASGVAGTEVTLTAFPAGGYKFKEWQVVSGGVTVTDNKFTIGTANVEIKAIFEEITYLVTVKEAGHGKVTADRTSAPEGAKVTLTLTPDEGYELDTIEVKDPAGNKLSIANNVFTMPRYNVTVTATFKAVPVPVSYSITGGANGAWIKGSGLNYTITAKRSVSDNECITHFTGVMVDSYILSITDYTAVPGSTIVTIKAYALQRLSVGVHTVTLYFDDGTASTYLYVWADPRYPSTGDERPTVMWAVLAGVTAVGMGAVVFLGIRYRKKKKKAGDK